MFYDRKNMKNTYTFIFIVILSFMIFLLNLVMLKVGVVLAKFNSLVTLMAYMPLSCGFLANDSMQ